MQDARQKALPFGSPRLCAPSLASLRRTRSRPSHALMDQGPARHPRSRRRARHRGRRQRDRRMRRARPIAGDSSRYDVQRLAPCRAAGAHQRASSLLPDADARPSRRLRQGAHSLARFDGARLGPHDARGLAHRDPDGAGRTDAVRLHDRGRSSQSLSPEPHERDRHRGRRGDEARPAHDGHARIDGHFREGRRLAARTRSCRIRRRSSRTASGCCASITTPNPAR